MDTKPSSTLEENTITTGAESPPDYTDVVDQVAHEEERDRARMRDYMEVMMTSYGDRVAKVIIDDQGVRFILK
ncbi:uncharacterized protein SPPG_09297 [Spizellomyces punctatus DAOM BR117]|uniref:Uncharacterized protein n=1 Tax=Spizellomyces punctatus (strain DAOM BR117) TaxID=645134 RepID=A0A0L0HER0_SPIPD|nr:uncharacterized protein SPPG_09297 [Spizellomyces punctatus DAOM BR117]KNC99474.1 hypothetical protein SPPG_09297 [Spizellomyces punctatus DAOM BR117]|eukprot:XP_016607514.1 hypothetical protein SPPG_09297 [Spizellomyces punctatus DAOM BR117]